MPSSASIVAVPAGYPLAHGVTISVDGHALPVMRCEVADHARFGLGSLDGRRPIQVVVTARHAIARAVVRPLHRGVAAVIDGASLRFTIDRPRQLSIEIDDDPPLYLFADPPEADVPDPGDPGVVHFGPGLHDAGVIRLGSGDTLYLAPGAVVHGSVHAIDAERVRIRGRGILDGSRIPRGEARLILFENCRDVVVEGITTIDTPSWNLVFGACDRVHVDRVKLIGWVVGSDGTDVAGSSDVLIENSFYRNNDDCIAVKALDATGRPGGPQRDWSRDVERVRVRACVMYNAQAGNALEVGFETRTATMRDIVFSDLDIIGAHGEGGVFTIHAGDRATISGVRYEDIRVEHFYDRLVDLRVLHSRWSRDHERGRIRGVHFKDIAVIQDLYNTPSLIGGFDAAHGVEDVVFEGFRIGDTHVGNADHLQLFTNAHVSGIAYR